MAPDVSRGPMLLSAGFVSFSQATAAMNAEQTPTQVPRLHVIGRKNSGKTTLIVELVEHLTAHGLRVGTIKHSHHHHEFDAPGKDSFLHRQAGASVVGLVGPKMAAAYRNHPTEQRDEAEEFLAPLFRDCDLVLVEGRQQTTAPKVEVWRPESGQPPLALTLRDIAAVITDSPCPGVSCSLWARADIAGLARQILTLLHGQQTPPPGPA